MERTRLSLLVDNYIKEAKSFYPHLRFSQSHSFYSGDEPTSCEFEFGFNGNLLKDTEYYSKGNSKLIHYTSSIQNLVEILNSGYLRLSNLVALNDPQELSFITNNLEMKFSEDEINEYKREFFSASFCKVLNLTEPDDFPMWRLYGGDGYGAAIIFEVINYDEEWSNFVLSKVQYGNNPAVDRYRSYFKFHNEFQEKNNYPLQNYPKSLYSIMAFHKNKIWSYEKEVRLLTHYKHDKYTLKDKDMHMARLKHSIAKNGKIYSYVELPLFGGEEYNRLHKKAKELQWLDFFKGALPILKIKEIIIGYKNNTETVLRLEDIVRHLSDQYRSHISIRDSHLRKMLV